MVDSTDDTTPDAAAAGEAGTAADIRVELFEPAEVRPWRFHNRVDSGMDDEAIDALSVSIRRDGQQSPGLARRLPPGDTHAVEAVYGIRRLEACRRADVPWRAEVKEQDYPDALCAVAMHNENELDEGVSPLENAAQWKSMLDAGVFRNQSALAGALGCHRGTVSRAVKTVTMLFEEEWLERLVRPVMHDFTGRSADRLADAFMDGDRAARAKRRARDLLPGEVGAKQLYDALFGTRPVRRETVYVRRKGKAGGGVVAAKIERDEAGGWSVHVRPHDESPAEMAELAEQVEAVLDAHTASAGGVRLGRRLVSMLSADDAKAADQAWFEGCVWAAARSSGLSWDRWRCMSVAQVLRSQESGWEHAVARAMGGRDADPGGAD